MLAHGFLWAMDVSIPQLALAVADQWHGCGIGRNVLAFLERAARHEGKHAIELCCACDNERAIKVYRAAGYETTGFVVTVARESGAIRLLREVQMVSVLDEACRSAVLEKLHAKREEAKREAGLIAYSVVSWSCCVVSEPRPM